ncbi:aspartate 4-decarboxylase [Bacillus sp. RG28]|uniref:Aminotransferase n=1 Tax=Gottfriedia endophytica TaxID=2820819 RepID=A0A940NKE7_9BACI|nr:aspartate 4-decarboxylase [Gottfriedia endophytica]MBP0726924.1 aspartate 4-decarboxylase [Gottfriedia endophytica]
MPLDKSDKRRKLMEGYKKLSPFELKDKLLDLAKATQKKRVRAMFNAGRGNPNWTAATPRQAFFTLGQFAVEETQRIWKDGDLAGMPYGKGIADRFYTFVKEHKDSPGIELLKNIVDYGITKHNFEPNRWIYELVDGIIADNYPVPDRMLLHTEQIVHDYIMKELCSNQPIEGKFDLFAVEGGTAAMCYIFDSLVANHLLEKGDRIALMVPIFTPYLEIPHLSRYDFQIAPIFANAHNEEGYHTWQYTNEELDKIADPNVKALFVVNPSNPPSVAINKESMEYLKSIVKNKNPNLMIITDDVYGTFVDDFHSIMSELPYNTVGVYSYSKYFGATGWRLGVIALHQKNVFDQLITELPQDQKKELLNRYETITTEPEKIQFINRIVADSRQVALNHTAGLSTPQQVQMAIFSAFALLDEEDKYKSQTKAICRQRKKLLYDHLGGIKILDDKNSTSYYTQIDLMVWGKIKYGEEFIQYLKENYYPTDLLFRLAEEDSIVLLNGAGFKGPEWSIRISLANLQNEDYIEIGKALNRAFEEYAEDWRASIRKNNN